MSIAVLAATGATTALSILQIATVGRELYALFAEGLITEEQMIARWKFNIDELVDIDTRWVARQKQKLDDAEEEK